MSRIAMPYGKELRYGERLTERHTRRISQAKWNYKNINVVHLLDVTAIIAETVEITLIQKENQSR